MLETAGMDSTMGEKAAAEKTMGEAVMAEVVEAAWDVTARDTNKHHEG